MRAMGIRQQRGLEQVSIALLREWQAALQHPALAQRFADPIAFAVSQLREGNAPPHGDELTRWAEYARRRADPYDSWRHIAPIDVPAEGGTTIPERCWKALGIEAPVDLNALLADTSIDEEVYRALRARSSCR